MDTAAEQRDATPFDWAADDGSGLQFPAHAAALREGGCEFLTRAFRSAGVIEARQRVSRITRCEPCGGGSTGAKLLLDVEYEPAAPAAARELFVKFSRDFNDPVRDQGRAQMAQEVRFAQLSQRHVLPLAVPACSFAGWHAASGSGLLITQRIAFGRENIAPQYAKCRDDELPDAPAHYRALLAALARLAAADRAGRLPADLAAQFPFSFESSAVAARAPYSVTQLQSRVQRYAAFAAAYPALLPETIRTPVFLARLQQEVALLAPQVSAIEAALASDAQAIALCHWNAHIDNAWFWRDETGALHCGLLDWGCASRMHLAMALWGCLSGAEYTLWETQLDALLAHFIAAFSDAGGGTLAPPRLRRQLLQVIALMTMRWLLDVPAALQRQIPDLARIDSPRDPRIRDHEAPRAQLQLLTTALQLWQREDFASLLPADAAPAAAVG